MRSQSREEAVFWRAVRFCHKSDSELGCGPERLSSHSTTSLRGCQTIQESSLVQCEAKCHCPTVAWIFASCLLVFTQAASAHTLAEFCTCMQHKLLQNTDVVSDFAISPLCLTGTLFESSTQQIHFDDETTAAYVANLIAENI